MDFELFTRLTHKVIKVETMNRDGTISAGTGVIVGHGFVVTNCHVTFRARSIELVRGEFRAGVDAQQADVEHDLCLLRAPHFIDSAPVEMASDSPRVGQTVHAVGFILGIAPRLNIGEIDALYDFDGGRIIQSTTPFTSGASGGGLFDDKGKLVGIITFKYRGGTAYYFSLPVRWVVDAMSHFDGQPVAPLDGMPFWGRPRDEQPLFLRAATYAAENNWPDMAAVASKWADSEPSNASAWRALGKANYEMRNGLAAIGAYRKAIAFDRDNAPTWHALGLSLAIAGRPAEIAGVHNVLLGLDGKLAADLAQHTFECADSSVQPC